MLFPSAIPAQGSNESSATLHPDSSNSAAFNIQKTEELKFRLKSIIGKQKSDSLYRFYENEPEVINFVCSYSNYSLLQNTAYPADLKFKLNLEFTDLVKTILSNYYRTGSDPDKMLPNEKEITMFMILLLNLTSNQLELADTFMEKTPAPTKSQQEGYNQMISGVAIMINGLLTTINQEYKFYSEQSICNLSESFSIFYLRASKKFSTVIKEKFDSEINTTEKNHPYLCVRKNIK